MTKKYLIIQTEKGKERDGLISVINIAMLLNVVFGVFFYCLLHNTRLMI